jgi:hypothetical protein
MSPSIPRLAQRVAPAIALCLLLAVASASAQEPARIDMTVDRNTLSIEDELRLEIKVTGSTEINGPDISDFEVTGQSSQTSIDFGRSRTITQTVVLRPKRAGTLTIGKVTALVRGRPVAEAAAIAVTVTEPRPPEPVTASDALDLERLAAEPAFIRWAVPRASFYLGEPFPMTLELWVRVELSPRNPELIQVSKLDGLLVEDLKVEPGSQRRALGNAQFEVYPLSVKLATPLKAGKVLIDSTSLRLPISEGGFLSSTRRLLRTSTPFHLDILELPAEGRPAGFSPRNVGQFTLNTKILDDRGTDASRVTTGQRFILRAEVIGQGNLQALEAPTLTADPSFEVSPLTTQAEDRVMKSASGMAGTRVFQWLVSAKAPGNLTTPSIALPFWDPVAKRYQIAEVKGRTIEVTGAAISPERDQALSLGEDVGPIAEQATLTRGRSGPLAHNPLYLIAVLLPLIGYIAFEVAWRRKSRDDNNPTERAARHAHMNAKKRLKAAESALRDGLVKDFYGQLSRTLTSYLEERANLPATGMTHSEVRLATRAAGYPQELVDRWVVEMENCDFARFAPSGSAADKMKEAGQRVAALIDDLEHIQPERRP